MSGLPDELREWYDRLADMVAGERFGPPPAGEWDARQVAGHLTANAENVRDVLVRVRGGEPARLDGPADHAPAAVDRFAGQGFDAVADALRSAGYALADSATELTDSVAATEVEVFIQHHGQTVVDGPMAVGDLVGAEVRVHLPAHQQQLLDLRRAR